MIETTPKFEVTAATEEGPAFIEGSPINGKFKRVYSVYETTDEYGRHGALIGVYDNPITADKYADKRGWYGGKAAVVVGWALVTSKGFVVRLQDQTGLPMSIDLIEDRKKRKAAALAKLTAEDRALLGLPA